MIHRPLEDWEYPDPDDDDPDGDAPNDNTDAYGDAADEYEAYDFISSDQPETRPCPACGAEIYEDAEQCPVCGQYITFRNPALAGMPWWVVALGVLGIIAVILTMSGF